jgi:hypothetical protein
MNRHNNFRVIKDSRIFRWEIQEAIALEQLQQKLTPKQKRALLKARAIALIKSSYAKN